jgi:hypothetical protein
MNVQVKFSDELQQWVQSDAPKSLGALSEVFEEKTFAVAIMLMMLVAATPIPTGGIAFVFQINAAAIAVQMVLGRHTLWIPRRWREHELHGRTVDKAIPFFIRRVRWLEKYSLPRWASLFGQRFFIRLIGLVLIGFAIAAALAPPFSGLETLPGMGGVLVALAIIFEDIVMLAVGVVIGTGGIVLLITVGAAVVRLIRGIL